MTIVENTYACFMPATPLYSDPIPPDRPTGMHTPYFHKPHLSYGTTDRHTEKNASPTTIAAY
jgi:hypothetical protein